MSPIEKATLYWLTAATVYFVVQTLDTVLRWFRTPKE